MKKLFLAGKHKDLEIIIDDDDFDLVSKLKWSLHTSGYVRGYVNKKPIYLHHLVLGKPKEGFEVDHINFNKRDNRKANLRFLTIKENREHKRRYGRSKWRADGLKWAYKKRSLFQSTVTVNGKTLYLGTFANPYQASKTAEQYLRINNLI